MNSAEFYHILPYINSNIPNIRNFTDFLYSLFSLSFSPDIETINHTSHPILDHIHTNLIIPSPFLAPKIYSLLKPLSTEYVEYKAEIPIHSDNITHFTMRIFVHKNYTISETIIPAIYNILSILCRLYPSHMACVASFVMVWIPLDEPKRLDTEHIQALLNGTDAPKISPLHINSGFTVFNMETPLDVPSTTVFLYRREDAFKTIIHEMFHALRLDGNLPTSARENETYAETWAVLLYIGWLSFADLESKDGDDFHTNYITLLAIETAYSRIQMHKLALLEVSSFRETNGSQYYIDKYFVLENIEDFLKWCEVHNEEWLLFGGKYECDECAVKLFSSNAAECKPFMDVREKYIDLLDIIRNKERTYKRDTEINIKNIPRHILETMRMILL